jgi:hypothetical protein
MVQDRLDRPARQPVEQWDADNHAQDDEEEFHVMDV